MKALVIPDIHLKTAMIERAIRLMRSGRYDACVLLGDFNDDWGQEYNLKLYAETYRLLISLVQEFPDKAFLCWGNHDLSYRFLKSTTKGYSEFAVYTVRDGMKELENCFRSPDQVGVVHILDRVIFSHAGVTESFVREWLGEAYVMNWFANEADRKPADLVKTINSFYQKELWRDSSPVWSRNVIYPEAMFPPEFIQVVGHTPVEKPYWNPYHKVLCLDTFSTDPNHHPIGDQRFVCIETTTGEWAYAD